MLLVNIWINNITLTLTEQPAREDQEEVGEEVGEGIGMEIRADNKCEEDGDSGEEGLADLHFVQLWTIPELTLWP